MTYEDAQRAWDNLSPEDFEPMSDDDRMAEQIREAEMEQDRENEGVGYER